MGFVFMSRILDNTSVDNYISMFLANSVKVINYCWVRNET